MRTMRILGTPGSLRRDWYNRRLLRAAAGALPREPDLAIWEGLAAVPPYSEDEDRESAPHGAIALRVAIEPADAVLISTPEYNGTLPGQLKNAIDWPSRPFPHNVLRAKPVAVIGASTSIYGAVWAQADARKALGLAGARVLERQLPVPLAQQQFGTGGELVDPELQGRLKELLRELVDVSGARHGRVAA